MNIPRSILEESLGNWRDTREGLIEEVLTFPAGKIEFAAAPGTRTVREVVQHILEVAMMMTGELTREDTNFRRAPWPKLLKMYAAAVYGARTRSELVRLLRSQFKDAEKQFRAVGDIGMVQLIRYFDGSPGTKLGWFHHGIAHEMYHRGQLTVFARGLGLEPALTRRIRGG